MNTQPRHPKDVRTWCYMCMNYIWHCLVRKTCSPALFSPLFPRPPKGVVVKHVVVPKTLPWNAADSPLPGSVWIVALFRRKVKAVSDISPLIFCVAVDKEMRRAGVTSAWVHFPQETIIVDKTKNDEIAGLLLNTVEKSGKMWYNTKSYILRG